MFRVEVVYQFFHRCHTVNAFVGFHGVVVVYESDEFGLAVDTACEGCLPVPHLHERPYHSFRLPVRLWGFHLRVSLFDSVLTTELHEGVILTISLVFGSVV